MFNFIIKNALTKKSKLLLTSLTIIIACIVGLLSVNISQQVNEGIIELSDGYDVVIGPAGSESQLAFNALFFSEDALGTVDYSVYEKLQSDIRINKVIPIAMADSYGNYRIVGTSEDFLINYKIKGESFSKEYECVIGRNVAQKTGLSVGDTFFSTHGAMGTQHAEPLTVVGIMEKTNTNYDNVIFTHIETVWGLHGSSHNHNQSKDVEHEEEHTEDEHTHGLTALLIKTKSLRYQAEITREYSKVNGLQAITPTVVLRKSLQSIDMSKQIVYALTSIIFVMSIVLLFIIALLTSQDLRKDIQLMRFVGISSIKIKTIFIIQSVIVSLFSLCIAFLLSHLALGYVNGISTGYGIVINPSKIYTNEYYIVIAMFIATMLPTIIYMARLFKKDITKI